jgi:hypothetical protein
MVVEVVVDAGAPWCFVVVLVLASVVVVVTVGGIGVCSREFGGGLVGVSKDFPKMSTSICCAAG